MNYGIVQTMEWRRSLRNQGLNWPVEDINVKRMIDHADLIVTAGNNGQLVG
ncbi:hypothetical protein ACFSCZ_02440 [Siminovitchia sediminis]|uniref:Uncharacterized protein n=1 Tax=Siminovitchia sediminis TaxID=1274353 RepID=A0ABW4KCN9_9BACI